MPSKPDKINRNYLPQREAFGGRSIDSSWFYNDYRWRKYTSGFKKRNPVCVLNCKDEGVLTPTEVVDHKEQSAEGARGWDLSKLKDDDYNAACHRCHNKRSGSQRHK